MIHLAMDYLFNSPNFQCLLRSAIKVNYYYSNPTWQFSKHLATVTSSNYLLTHIGSMSNYTAISL